MYTRIIIGARGLPTYYVMRPKVVVAMPAPPLATDQPYSEGHVSIEDELIVQASHSHALSKSDRRDVHQLVERAIHDK